MEARKTFNDSDDLCRHIAADSVDADGISTVILGFSRGKDAIASWLQLRRQFKRVIPFHFSAIPGLPFVEDSLRYFTDFLDGPILDMPHPALLRMLKNYLFQPPDRVFPLMGLDLQAVSYERIDQALRQRFNAPKAFIAIGSRAADSPIRAANIARNGPVNYNRRSFFPIYDWRLDRLIDELRKSGVMLPIDYRLFGSSFDGIDYRYMGPLKRHLPEDYRIACEWFPLIELDVLRRERAEAARSGAEVTRG